MDLLKRIGGTMARVRLPSFSVVLVAAGGFALVALVVLRVAGIGGSSDSNGGVSAPAPAERLGVPCTWWDHGHAHEGHIVNAECVSADAGHRAGDHAADDIDVSVEADELRPAARGEAPPPLPVFHATTGERYGSHMPLYTPAVLEWSDWCFFGDDDAPAAGAFLCSQELAQFSWALSHLGADEACVLDQHRRNIEARRGGMPGPEARNEYGWHRCASVVDPDPQIGAGWAAGCEALSAADPEVAAVVGSWMGDCVAWEADQRALTAGMRAPDCSRAMSLAYLWKSANVSAEYLDSVGSISQC